MRMAWRLLLAGLTVTARPGAALAQLPPNPSYDGRATLARLRFTPRPDPAGCQQSDSPAGAGWGHDYPTSVQGLMKAVTSLTSIEAPVDSNVLLEVTDPELMRYPVAMLTEPGCFDPSEAEVKALRTYLLKGGFLVVDDMTFADGTPEHLELSIARFEEWMQRVLPEGRLLPVPASDPIFDGFFKVDSAAVPGFGASDESGGELHGIYKDNDPTKWLMVVVSYRGILGHYWRHVDGLGSGLGEGQSRSGMAYRLGLNYFVYGLSH
jgi:hypothetical protein